MTTESPYVPSKKILQNYAHVLVNFALGQKEGILKGEVVECIVPDIAKPLALELQNAILRAGGHVLMRIVPTGFDKDYFELATQEQLTFFPAEHLKTRADLIDHSIGILADPHPHELSETEPAKIMTARNSKKAYRDWLNHKENNDNFTWTLALWGVEAKAQIVGLTLEEYWQQIINACFLDAADPIAEWRKVNTLQTSIKNALNELSIESLHMTGADMDLTVKLGPERLWAGGTNRNIPSFELFTSPDWRGTNGWIKFSEPVYRYGNVIEGARLEFTGGIVTKATATRGEQILTEMLKTENANKLGEYSLTDRRLSHITHPMAETLYDENIGGRYGNTHVAIGMAYKDCFRGNPGVVTEAEWQNMGYNDSAEHTDIISTTDRTVTATLPDGTQKIIYVDGQFTVGG